MPPAETPTCFEKKHFDSLPNREGDKKQRDFQLVMIIGSELNKDLEAEAQNKNGDRQDEDGQERRELTSPNLFFWLREKLFNVFVHDEITPLKK